MPEKRKDISSGDDIDSYEIQDFSQKFISFLEKESALEAEEAKEISKKFISFLEKEYKLGLEEFKEIISRAKKKVEIRIPVSIFDNEELSILEAVCKYLKEGLKLRFHQIALLLNRNDRTIWVTYNNSLKKRKEKLSLKKSEISIPISLLKNRKLTVFEIIALYLKDNYRLNYHQISVLLKRDERNIWTTYQRARKKNVK